MSVLSVLAHEIRTTDVSARAVRSFGRVVGGVLLALGAFALWRRGGAFTPLPTALLGTGTALVVLGLVAPALLRPLYRVWMALAVVLGFVMTRVLLTLVYVLVVTPTGLLRRTFGQSPVLTHPDPSLASYWIPRERSDVPEKERLERQF